MEVGKRFARDLNEEVVEVASLPQPLSPFRWANYIETKSKVYQGFIDLIRREPSQPDETVGTKADSSFFLGRWVVMGSLYRSPSKVEYSSWPKRDGSPWVEKALSTDGARFYYWFARFPIARVVDSNNGSHRVELTDVRFFVPRIRMPFSYYMEFDDSGRLVSEGFAGNRRGSEQKSSGKEPPGPF